MTKKRKMTKDINEIKLRTSHLNNLRKRNLDTGHINHKLYHLLYRPETFINSYGNICKNRGSRTLGIKGDEGYLLSFGIDKAKTLANKFKTNSYDWKPTRRTWIPKPGKNKLCPIDTSTQKDRIVQEAIRGILECIFEPEFSQFEKQIGNETRPTVYKCTNYGFRPGKSAFQALYNLKNGGKLTNIGIEGDIQGAYNNVDHDLLLNILSKRIKDKKFLSVMRNLLKSGVMKNNQIEPGLIGTPQGGIVSPLLFNIYMLPFDKFIFKQMKLIESKNKNLKPRVNPRYSRLSTQITKLEKSIKSLPRGKDRQVIQKERKRLVNKRRNYSYQLPYTKRKQAVYARYADDWLILFSGNKKEAEALRQKISAFIESELKLKLDEEKTLVTRLDKGISFLGYEIKAWGPKQSKVSYIHGQKNQTQKSFPKRMTSQQINILPCINRLRLNLANKGFLDTSTDRGKSVRIMLSLSDHEIALKFRYVVMGIINYYKYCDKLSRLHFCLYVLKYSCYNTLAAKHRSTLRKAKKQYGRRCTVTTTFELKSGIKVESISIPTLKELIEEGFFSKKYEGQKLLDHDPFKLYFNFRTKLKTLVECCRCGSDEYVEMFVTVYKCPCVKNVTI